MNRIIEDSWKQFKGKMKTRWDEFTDGRSCVSDDKHVEIECKIQEASAREEYMMKDEILPRRAVLRGALAVGCGLWLPIIFSGCDSNKGANSTSSASSSSPTSTGTTPPAATSKVSQTSVQYQTQPKGELKCSGCMNFIAESNTCKLVDGQISPNGWCSLWTKKA
jgi:uncharacterized protein YjbJ (UPF0337 family)